MSEPHVTLNTTLPRSEWTLRIDFLVILLSMGAVILLGSMLWMRAHSPSLGLLAEPASHGWRVTSISRDSTAGGVPKEWLGATLTQACAPDKPQQCVALQPQWMIDTPIRLPSASSISHFVKDQQALLALAGGAGQQVILHAMQDQTSASSNPMQATVTLENAREFLTERYAIVVLTALVIYTIGCAMLAFVRRTREVWLAFAMCTGFFLFMVMRSWYTDRTWAQPEAAWWIVITAFRIGVMTCCVTTVMTLWNLRLHNFNVLSPLWLCLALCGVIILHSLGVIDSAAWGYRAINLVFAVMILIIALASWWQAKSGTDGQRLRSKTFGQILLIGYLPVMVTTPLWTFRPDLQQIAFLQNIAVGVVAMPIVIMVAQSAQYQLHAFWWRLWLVLVAAVAALVGASVMVLLSGFSASASLGLMLIFTTASIYGLRGWLEKRLIGQAPAMEQFLPQIMALQGLQGDAMEQAWQRILQDAFAPQRLVVVNSAPTEVRLVDQGDSLLVPALGSAGALSLTGAGSYTRSFGRSDALLVSSLHALALQGLQARESFVAGAVQERRRIAADLHDDIGGKLLHLANSGGQEASYARNTLEDLRTITRGLSAQPRPLSELLADIQYQLGQRAERADIELGWETTLPAADSATMIGSRQSTVLASICSELLRNAMQHQGVRQVHFHIGLADWTLQLQCDNDGAPTDPMQWKSGLGTTSIRRRVHDLQGQCAWASRSGGGASFSANWPLMSWLSADTGAFQMDQLS